MGKWLIVDLKQKVYLVQWNLVSEFKKCDYEPHTRIIRNDEEFQKLMNELSNNDDVMNLTIWKRQDIDYEV